MSSVHRIKLLVLGLLLFPIALFAQTSTTGRIDEGPLAARPAICTPGDYYVSTDTNPVVEYKCSTGNTWTPEATGGGGGSPPGAPLNSPQCNSLGTGFKACGNNNAILYVSATGNDSNNGTSWDTAKLTIMAAVCALPGGNCSTTPKQAGGGTIYFTTGVACNSNTSAGCWIAGAGDSQYPNMTGSQGGPTAWTIQSTLAGLNFICATAENGATNISRPFCGVTGPPRTVAPYVPKVWVSGNTLGSFYINGMSDNGFAGGPWGRIGIDSATAAITGTPVVTQTVSFTIENSYSSGDTGGGALGAGPTLAIGNGFWMHLHDSGFYGASAPEGCTVSAASRTSNVVTITTTNCGGAPTQCPFVAGDHLSIRDTTGDGTFNGTFTAASSCGATNTVTFNQTGPNFSGSVGSSGIIADDRYFGIVCYSCQIEMARMHNSGGLKFYSGSSSNLQLNDDYIEGTGPQTAPIVWISSLIYGSGGVVDMSGLFMSDTPLLPSMINDGGPLVFIHTEASQSTAIRGPAVLIGGLDAASRTTGLVASGQAGWYDNQNFEAHIDIARRQVPLASNLSPNLAAQNPASWVLTTATTASGKLDPFGGTGAIEIDSASSGSAAPYGVVTQTVNVGDVWYFGGWVRGPSGLGTSGPFQFSLVGAGFGSGDLCIGGQQGALSATPFKGDGNWYWVTSSCQIWANPSSAGVVLNILVSSSQPVQVYRPFLFRVPAGTASVTEIADEINSLAFGPSTQAGAGDIVYPADKKLCMSSGSATNEFCAYLTHSNTANRSNTMPDLAGGFVTFSAGNEASALTGQPLVAQNGFAATFTSPGIQDGNGGVSVTTTPYTIQCDSGTTLLDRGHILRFQPGASVVTVPLSTAGGCLGGFVVSVVNDGAGTLTFNRTSGDTFSIFNGGSSQDGSTSFTLNNGQHATLNQGAIGIWEVRIVSTLSNGTVVDASSPPYNVLPGNSWIDAKWTNGSNTVSIPGTDPPFTLAMNGWLCGGTSGTVTGQTTDANSVLVKVLGTFTFVSSTSGTCSGTAANASASGAFNGVLIMGPDDTASLNAAWQAASGGASGTGQGQCNTLLLPAGILFTKTGQFNTVNCNNAMTGPTSAGLWVYGWGRTNTRIVPAFDQFNFTGVTYGGKNCLFFCHNGININQVAIWGAGYQNIGAQTAAVVACSNDGQINNVEINNWGMSGGANFWAFWVPSGLGCSPVFGLTINFSGGIGCEFDGGAGVNNSECGPSGIRSGVIKALFHSQAVTFGGGSQASGSTAIVCSGPNQDDVVELCNGGTWYSTADAVGGTSSETAINVNTGGAFHANQTSTALGSGTALALQSSGTAFTQDSNLTGANFGLSVAGGGIFRSQGGNNFFSGATKAISLGSGTATVLLSPSDVFGGTYDVLPTITGTIWGTSPTITNCTGINTAERGCVLVTEGTSPPSSGTFIITFNQTYSINGNPSCVLTFQNGTGSWNARVNSILTTVGTTAMTWTIDNNAVALTAASTYGVNWNCTVR